MKAPVETSTDEKSTDEKSPKPSIVRAWLRPVLVTLLVQVLAIALVVAVSPLRVWMLEQAVATDYFEPELDKPDEFEPIAGPIYAFRHGIDRSLVVDAGDALAVIDPFNKEHAKRLAAELDRRFPGKPVGWLFYSHNHLDHVRGGAELHPREVLAHRDVMSYVADWPHGDVLPVTKTLEGDVEMKLGAVPVRLLYLGHSHSETLYAYHFPDQRTVFAPDAAFLKTMPPFGLPDHYFPGYLRALDRIAGIDFDACVPSHFRRGNKADFLAYRQMMIDFRQATTALVDDMGGDPSRGVEQRKRIGPAYLALRAKYGAWHGFETMFLPHFFGAIGGTYLGY